MLHYKLNPLDFQRLCYGQGAEDLIIHLEKGLNIKDKFGKSVTFICKQTETFKFVISGIFVINQRENRLAITFWVPQYRSTPMQWGEPKNFTGQHLLVDVNINGKKLKRKIYDIKKEKDVTHLSTVFKNCLGDAVSKIKKELDVPERYNRREKVA